MVHNDMSGHVVGSAVQIGSAGSVALHLPPVPAPRTAVPTQVPAAPPQFVNREPELSETEALLAAGAGQPAQVVVFSGPPGIGKTATALRLVHQSGAARTYTGGVLYVDFTTFRGPRGTAVADAVARCLRALGVADEVMPARFAERVNLYRTLTADQPVLVVLDQVTEPAQVPPLIPTAPGSAVLVTSNERLGELVVDGAEPFWLTPLDNVHSAQLLARTCGAARVAAEPAAVAALVELCEGLPLALRIAAARLRLHPGLSIAALVSELADESRGLSGFTVGGEQRLAVELSVVYRGLPDPVARLYRRLALLPGPDFTPAEAAALGDAEPDAVRVHLDRLAEANLVVEGPGSRYRFHGLVRRHALRCAHEDEPEAERTAAVHRVVRHYLVMAAAADLVIMGPGRLRCTDVAELLADSQPFAGDNARNQALDWLDAERATLLAATRTAAEHGWHRETWQLAETATALYVNRRYLTDWVESTELGVLAARSVGDARVEARLRSFVSRALTDLGELDRARAELEAALPLAERSADPRLIASVWELFGRLFDHTERDRAAEAYQRSLDLFEQAEDRRGVAFVTYFLGCAQDAAGRHAEALVTLRRSVDLIRQVDQGRMTGRALAATGTALAHLGRHAEAAAALREAIEILARGGYFHYEAQAQEALAEVARLVGDHVAERRCLTRALEVHQAHRGPRAAQLRARLDALADS
ncbi:NB-ARC domain-containing protein [Goodfellowiella coeruleoviolacea]|uniref:AAA ATPase domain-containing protein n=1 Tax=Goodfellowiella coeruleoviolacea TaxID=334858 RepID=A0AAE3G996_9PSEU|nr:NB-ARC domain-containing protein [Goodfellowiella coeruleoviolacea]MCP2164041.1 AAA ATPase domain-containing protein [Goodfellowiella coeruleoviolacea]